MNELISKIDPSMWYILGGLLVLFLIFAIIKKAFTIAILIGIFVVLFSFFGSSSSDAQNKYGVSLNEGILAITMNDKTTEINTNDMQNLRVEEGEEDEYFIRYTYKEKEEEIAIPKFLVSTARKKIAEIKTEIEAGENDGV